MIPGLRHALVAIADEERLAHSLECCAGAAGRAEWLAVCEEALEISREAARSSPFPAPTRGEILARAVRIAEAGGRPLLGALLGGSS